MADGPSLIVEPGGAVPFGYTLAPGEAFGLETVSAQFDGSGSAGAYLPALGIYAQSGELLARTFASEVASGASAEVTFSPF